MNQENIKTITTAVTLLGLGVALGAFGAHGLEAKVSAKHLATYKTGIQYHFYHAFGLLMLAFLQHHIPQKNFKLVKQMMIGGILLFSGNCYLYAVTGMKVFAMIVPVGGTLFLGAWFWCAALLTKRS